MWMILACERCAEVGMYRAGVYRDLRGETLCEDCDDDRECQQQEAMRVADVRPLETGRDYKRPKVRF